jgi:hypothetical protein
MTRGRTGIIPADPAATPDGAKSHLISNLRFKTRAPHPSVVQPRIVTEKASLNKTITSINIGVIRNYYGITDCLLCFGCSSLEISPQRSSLRYLLHAGRPAGGRSSALARERHTHAQLLICSLVFMAYGRAS